MSGGELTIMGGNQACVGQPIYKNVVEGIRGPESSYPKVLQGFDLGDGPRTRITQSARVSFTLPVLQGSGVPLESWSECLDFFSPPCSPGPSARLGKFLNGQWCHQVLIAHFLAGEEEGIGWLVRGDGRAPRLGHKEGPQRQSPHSRASDLTQRGGC